MEGDTREQLVALFKKNPQVKLAYFFGSRARGEAGPMSDYDIALTIDEREPKSLARLHLALITDISRCLNTDAVDVVLLNTVEQPELAYAIITTGELIYDIEPFRLIVEPRILNQYFDFYTMLKQYNLTSA